ncbi:nucleoid-associated protein [Methylomonas rhizoryzae]|uniref:nucleoid-associated protein n=1 Tax=Methylomonas rhizoryzae TaxID=2608981 RepID=UPI0012322415|nr:nucleoid-associated protein [Methylomonas rhizoryzae]
MILLTDEEKDSMSITRMIFHVVGKMLEEPILLEEINPPEHTDFFLDRIKSVLTGNLFEFKTNSNVERLIRDIIADGGTFSENTKSLTKDFQRLHIHKTMSMGAFFVFEITIKNGNRIYALIKYDNDDVVSYFLPENTSKPRLNLSHQNWVKKPEAMQKIALVRLSEASGGKVVVRDRSKPTNISDYFQAFLDVRRINKPEEMSIKLVNAIKDTFKAHRSELAQDIQKGGVNRIYEVLQQGGHQFNPDELELLITAVFGPLSEASTVRKTFKSNLKIQGISEETFQILPEDVPKPTRRRMDTIEGISICYDEEYRNKITTQPGHDGVTKIVITTAGIKSDDIDTEKNPRSH